MLARVRLSLGLLSDALDVAPWHHRERLIVSALPSIARKLIIPNLGQLVEDLPGVSLEIHATTAVESVESEVDVALRFGPGGWRGVETRFIAEEELVVVASPQYWPGGRPRSPEDLKGSNLITDRESSWRLWLEAAGLNADDFSSMLRVTDSALVVDAAVEGLGIGLARAQLVRSELERGSLIRLFERALPSVNSYWTVWNGSTPKRAVIQRFNVWISQLFAPPASSRV
jgi:LysR family glycine cleavage system transcriptional activator